MLLTILLAFAVMVVFIAGLLQFYRAANDMAQVASAVLPDAASQAAARRRSRLDRTITRSRFAPAVQEAITFTAPSLTPSAFVGIYLAACGAIGFALGAFLSWILFPIGVYAGMLLFRAYVRRQREQRKEDFIAQMPELARTLSNASSAGLSIRTAIAMAAEDLDEPARNELQTVSNEIALGISLDTAMSNLEKRLPSRELAILVSTLVVSSRSGGAIVSSLRDISDTLEARKEVRREIRTTYAQIISTSYSVLGVGALSLVFLETLNGGTVDTMLRNPIGQAALLFAVAVYSVCILVVRRVTRVEF